MRLILHIGGAKCGSTAIQSVLRENHTWLAREKGILVPGTNLEPDQNVTGEQIFFFERMLADKENGLDAVQRRIRRLRQHMQDHGLTTLIISGENLINPGGFERFFVEAQELFDLDIVLYIRRQDQYFVSAWQQWHLKTFPSLQDYVDERKGHDANWRKFIAPWETTLDKARITLRRFQRDLLFEQDIVADFFRTASLGDLPESIVNNERNRSFDEHLGDMAARIRDVFEGPHDNDFYTEMVRAVGPRVFKSSSGSFLFSLEERQALMDAYAEDNDILKAKYFPELSQDEPLFAPPKQSEIITVSEDEKRKAEINLLTRAVYNLSRRISALEGK